LKTKVKKPNYLTNVFLHIAMRFMNECGLINIYMILVAHILSPSKVEFYEKQNENLQSQNNQNL
jgi:hypothetical protein